MLKVVFAVEGGANGIDGAEYPLSTIAYMLEDLADELRAIHGEHDTNIPAGTKYFSGTAEIGSGAFAARIIVEKR